jgi:DNA polymerase II small subunit
MVIDEVPDVFVMGHTHAFDVNNYKGVNLISAGTMQGQTDFQKRMGHKPDPGRVALINLKTRDTIVKELL